MEGDNGGEEQDQTGREAKSSPKDVRSPGVRRQIPLVKRMYTLGGERGKTASETFC